MYNLSEIDMVVSGEQREGHVSASAGHGQYLCPVQKQTSNCQSVCRMLNKDKQHTATGIPGQLDDIRAS